MNDAQENRRIWGAFFHLHGILKKSGFLRGEQGIFKRQRYTRTYDSL